MKKYILVFFTLLFMICLCVPYAQAQDNPKEIPEAYLVDANKPIILFFTATWCAPCKLLKDDMFKKEELKPLLEQFNLLMMDVDTAEGAAYQKAYGAEKQGIPHLVLLNTEQEVLAEKTGYTKRVGDWTSFLKKALKE